MIFDIWIEEWSKKSKKMPHKCQLFSENYDKGKALRDAEQYGKQTKSVHVKDTEGKRYPRSVLYFKTAEDEGKLHPTQFFTYS